jgi:DNA repair exonuclease SbcCD ATPase subunit
MSIFNKFFGSNAQDNTITTTKEGTLYYLRVRNTYTNFEETLCFSNDTLRRKYINTAKESTPFPNDFYFDTWEETAETRLQNALQKQREELTAQHEKDLHNLKYKLRSLQADKESLQKSARYKRDFLETSIKLDDTKAELKNVTSQYEYLAQQYNTLLDLIKSTKDRKENKESALQEGGRLLLTDITTILTSDLSELGQFKKEYKRELKGLKDSGLVLQGQLVIAIVSRFVDSL